MCPAKRYIKNVCQVTSDYAIWNNLPAQTKFEILAFCHLSKSPPFPHARSNTDKLRKVFLKKHSWKTKLSWQIWWQDPTSL